MQVNNQLTIDEIRVINEATADFTSCIFKPATYNGALALFGYLGHLGVSTASGAPIAEMIRTYNEKNINSDCYRLSNKGMIRHAEESYYRGNPKWSTLTIHTIKGVY